MKKKLLLVLCFLFLFCISCGKEPSKITDQKKLTVITTLFPLFDFAREIGGDKVNVVLLLPPGVEAHSFEPKPGDIAQINSADIFIYTGKYMEPWVERLLMSTDNKRLFVVDGSKGIKLLASEERHEDHHEAITHESEKSHEHEHGKYDPHIWLDFANARMMVENIRDGFVQKDPVNKAYYEKSTGEYIKSLQELDERYKDSLSQCRKNVFIHGGHFAFNYLSQRYGLHYISAYEGTPNAEPTTGKLIEMKRKIKEQNVHYIFYEELIEPRIANILAEETGVKPLKLNGAHNISKDEFQKGTSFIELMEENLANLKVGLECR